MLESFLQSSWFTPTVLFFLINVIGTIAFFSSSKNKETNDAPQRLTRAPSIILDRLKSFNLYRQRSLEPIPLITTAQEPETHDTHQLTRTPSLVDRLKSFNLYRKRSIEPEPVPPITTTQDPEPVETIGTVETSEHHISRMQSDTHPAAGEMPEKLPHKMKRSASAKSPFGHFHEEEIVADPEFRRPATTRAKKVTGEDEEVDAKADDFINRFKQQLKLQRLDSLLRCKDMLSRGQ